MSEPHADGSTRRADPEARLAAYFAAYADQSNPALLYLLRHPRTSLRALRDVRHLHVQPVRTGEGYEAMLVGGALPRHRYGPRSVVAALSLPKTAEEYSAGPSKQTLRRKARAAERAGVTWSPVDDPEERRLLLARTNEYERSHPIERYRKAPADNQGMLDVGIWLLARGSDGRPLHLSITPVDGPAALLALFRTFENTDDASTARYLMTRVLAERLIGLGVTHLYDGVHPANLPNGLRHFQRMVGFRLMRVARDRPAGRSVFRAGAVRGLSKAPRT